jgi:hypothetical protein
MLDLGGHRKNLIEVYLRCRFTEIHPKRLSDGFLVGIDPIQNLEQAFLPLCKCGGSPSNSRGELASKKFSG